MLTAWYGKNHFCIPCDCIVECKISRSITGMERHDHIHVKRRLKSIDVTKLKAQIVIAIFFRRPVAFFDDIFFQVESKHLHFHVPDLCKIIIHDKSQVRLSASEINDVYFLTFIFPDRIIDHLDKTVDLAELIIHGLYYFSLSGKNTHIHQRRDHLSLIQNIIFLPVMLCDCVWCFF